MTAGKKFKKTVRERMKITGEAYTTARLAILKEREATCEHVLVLQGALNEDLCCTKCSFVTPNNISRGPGGYNGS